MANCHIINCSQIYAIFGEFPIFWKFFLKKYYFSRPFFHLWRYKQKSSIAKRSGVFFLLVFVKKSKKWTFFVVV